MLEDFVIIGEDGREIDKLPVTAKVDDPNEKAAGQSGVASINESVQPKKQKFMEKPMKEWHDTIFDEHRDGMVFKLNRKMVEVGPGPYPVTDTERPNFLECCINLEAEAFYEADSREEYVHRITKIIQNINSHVPTDDWRKSLKPSMRETARCKLAGKLSDYYNIKPCLSNMHPDQYVSEVEADHYKNAYSCRNYHSRILRSATTIQQEYEDKLRKMKNNS